MTQMPVAERQTEVRLEVREEEDPEAPMCHVLIPRYCSLHQTSRVG